MPAVPPVIRAAGAWDRHSPDGHGLTINKRRSAKVRAYQAEFGGSFTAAGFAAALRHTAIPDPAPWPRSLPDAVDRLVGREQEIEQLERADARVLVIAGPAGVGKTALATHLAHRVRELLPEAALFVNLRGYDSGPRLDAGAALERMLQELGVPTQQIPADPGERAQLYRTRLAGRRMLVVLDNAATAEQVLPLLPHGRTCLTVITSRSPLPELTARDGIHRLQLGPLSTPAAQTMFAATTAPYRHGDDPAEVAELARLCAGLPLAIRIAAERASARPDTTLPDLIGELRTESALWDALAAQDAEHGDATRAVFSWTYRALPPHAARALRLLALHPGPTIAAGAAAAMTGHAPSTATGILTALVAARLLEPVDAEHYQLHDLIRAHGLGMACAEETETERRAALERVTLYYLRSADAAARAVQSVYTLELPEADEAAAIPETFHDRDGALRWYRTEQPTLLALVRAAAEAGLDRLAWQLPVALLGIHIALNPLDAWLEMSELAVKAARRADDPRAEALARHSLGIGAKAAGQLNRAAGQHRVARDLLDSVGDQQGAAHCAHSLALVQLQQRDLAAARTGFETSLAAARRDNDPVREASALCCLAATVAQLGQPEPAATLAEQSLALHAASRADPYLRVDPLLLLARIHREQGHTDQAAAVLDQCGTLAGDLEHPALTRAVLLERAELASAQGEHEHALELYWTYAHIQRSSGDRPHQVAALDGAGRTLRALGRLPEALEAHRGAVELGRGLGQPWPLALSLAHLAEALAAAAQPEPAAATGTEAITLLSTFPDPQAEDLRTRMRALS